MKRIGLEEKKMHERTFISLETGENPRDMTVNEWLCYKQWYQRNDMTFEFY